MSTENAFQFLFLNKEAGIQEDYEKIMETYIKAGGNEEQQNKIMEELILPLAKEVGMEFTMEEMKEVLSFKSNRLSDDELDQVAAGRGVIVSQYNDKVIYSCEMVENNTDFANYFLHVKKCPHYTGLDAGVTLCAWCRHLGRNN